jgi:hypothetical protein
MKRRDFLKTLPVIAATPMTLAVAELKFKNAHSRHLIALGTAASRLASKYASELSFDSVTYIDAEKPLNPKEGESFFSFQSPDYLFERVGHLRIAKSGHFPVLPLGQEIQSHLSGLAGDLVFLAGLGGVTAALLFQSIGHHYRNPHQQMAWLAMMPFAFEGYRKEHRSQLAIRVLHKEKLDPMPFYLEEIREQYGNLSIRSAFQKADEWMVAELNEI